MCSETSHGGGMALHGTGSRLPQVHWVQVVLAVSQDRRVLLEQREVDRRVPRATQVQQAIRVQLVHRVPQATRVQRATRVQLEIQATRVLREILEIQATRVLREILEPQETQVRQETMDRLVRLVHKEPQETQVRQDQCPRTMSSPSMGSREP